MAKEDRNIRELRDASIRVKGRFDSSLGTLRFELRDSEMDEFEFRESAPLE